MREIKFRYYSHKSKEMRSWDDLQKLHVHTVFNMMQPECKIMQFTGLKDKNGVDIYEGDVIKGRCDIGGKLKRFIGFVDVNLPYVTVIGVKQYSWKVCHIRDVRLFEVVGNIYENPELLD